MKQVLQHLKSGVLAVEDVPAPLAKAKHLLIETHCSLISAGTERMVVDFGRASLLQKALQKPDKVKQVLQKAKTDGIAATLEAVNARLDQPMALGYSNVGRVIAAGAGMEGYDVGDRVVSNGKHAEIVLSPKHLAAKIPDGVSDEEASFTVLASIALQGVRLMNVTLGEKVCVMGLGLIGLIAVQILRAAGCRVIGFDFDPARVELARRFGVQAHDLSAGLDPLREAEKFAGADGIDAVLITAATASNDVIRQSAQMSRKRGRIVLTGVVGLDLDRNDFYEKELTFQVSCSYGPGRYDPSYEEGGQDYPLPFVRWTEQRNFEAVLQLMAEKKLDVMPLLTRRVPLARAQEAYDALSDKGEIGMLIDYPAAEHLRVDRDTVVTQAPQRRRPGQEKAVIGIIGAGGFTQGQILPGLKKSGIAPKWISSAQGVSGSAAARRFGIENNTTDYRRLLDDREVNAVVIGTRHDSHARFVIDALRAGKNVFVEKPLCLTQDELSNIRAAYDAALAADPSTLLMVGYNRRFSPLTVDIERALTSRSGALAMVYTVNAGYIPADHWTQDQHIGGGRLVGEACHFIDYFVHLAKSPVVSAFVETVGDTSVITLRAQDGSIGQINYVTNGHKAYPKERCDVFFDGKVVTLDNFLRLRGAGVKIKRSLWRQDKGHAAGFAAFVRAVAEGGHAPIAASELFDVAEIAITLAAGNGYARK